MEGRIKMTKIDIISGFLGAGKTTLIRKLLQEAFQKEKLVLIENEFGEIGIDGGFLKDAGVEIKEMNSGCICCSLVGDFGTALQEVLEKFQPDRVIIEPSGVGKLSDVIKAVKGVAEKVPVILNSYTTVVDVKKCKMYMKNFGEFFNNQIESAQTIVLSRTQDVKEDKLEQCVKELKEHNPHATIITTPWSDLNGSQILSAMEKQASLERDLMEEVQQHEEHHHDHGEHEHEGHHHDHEEHEHEGHHHDHHHEGEESCECDHEHHHHDHHGHHHADEVFTSWGIETPHKYDKQELTDILKTFSETDRYGMILRAKGMVACTDGTWLYFDFVPEEYEIRQGDPDVTGRLCVIGSKLNENEIAQLFHVV